MILGLRLGRRLLGAAAIDDETVTFAHSRFTPPRQRVDDLAAPYFRQLLTDIKPTAVYYRAVNRSETVAGHIAQVLEREASALGIVVKPLISEEILTSFGLVPIRTRRQLRECVERLWPNLAQAKPERQPVVAEALAVALVGDFKQEMPGV